MRGENGYPETPDWTPPTAAEKVAARESLLRGIADAAAGRIVRRDDWLKDHAECPAHVTEPLTWGGDDG